jgi:hypothetical protein
MIDAAAREFVRQRAGNRCEYCHLPQDFSDLRFHVEHILPRQHAGADDRANLALGCPDCNLRKGPNLTGIDPGTGKIVRLFNPRDNLWLDHFRYDGGTITGKTAVGRTSVSLLKMNDPHRMRVRELLLELGLLV